MRAALVLLSAACCSPAAAGAPTTNVLVAYHTLTNRTGALAAIIASAAAEHSANVAVRLMPVADVGCDDLTWAHGVALGSPVFWGTMSGGMKTFLDDVQRRCWPWPVMTLRWRAGAAFATGAHVSAGKVETIVALHAFYESVQMVVVGNEPSAECLLGACATNRNESAAVPKFDDAERRDARNLAARLVTLATALRGLIDGGQGGEGGQPRG